jgi:hypothetical protein
MCERARPASMERMMGNAEEVVFLKKKLLLYSIASEEEESNAQEVSHRLAPTPN